MTNLCAYFVGHGLHREYGGLGWLTVESVILVFIFPFCYSTRKINTKIKSEWSHKQFVTLVHVLTEALQNIQYNHIAYADTGPLWGESTCENYSHCSRAAMCSSFVPMDFTYSLRGCMREHVGVQSVLVGYLLVFIEIRLPSLKRK